MKTFQKHRSLLLVFSFMAAFMGALLLSPEPFAGAMVAENGVIETLTTFLYLWGALVALFFVRKYAWQKGYGVALVFALMALREFDYNHFGAFALVKQKIKIRHPVEILFDPLIGLELRIMVLLLFVLIALFVGVFLLDNWKNFWKDLKERKQYAITIITSLVILTVSQALDNINPMKALVLFIFEESLEITFSMCLLIALYQYAKSTFKEVEQPRG